MTFFINLELSVHYEFGILVNQSLIKTFDNLIVSFLLKKLHLLWRRINELLDIMADKIERVKTLIIGSGPAGYTAAIYAARADLKPLMYTGMEPGGQLTTTTEVDNFPGYPEGIDGPTMMVQLQQQAERFGTEVRIGMITSVELSKEKGGIHKATADSGTKIEAETIIIATGATAKYLNIPSEQRLRGGGVSACAVCDGFFYKGQDVAIVGAGDTAAEEASYLANICNKVTMLVRKDHMRASKAMQHRVHSLKNIEVRYNTEVDQVLGEQVVEGLRMVNNQTGEKEDIAITGLFIAIGHKPNTDIFKGQLDMDETGYLITKGKSTKTNLPGVFASGDAQDKEYRQAVTAAGTGCMAALDAERYLASIGSVEEAVADQYNL
jgi:thioredoxin reductase (NADPH)